MTLTKRQKRVKQKISPLKMREHWTAMAFISLKYIGFLTFVFAPVVVSLLYSFTNYNPAYETEPYFSRIGDLWCWFDCYKKLFTDIMYGEYFVRAIGNNVFMLLSVPFGIAIGVVIAAILSRPAIKLGGLFRLLIYMPVVAGAVAMNYIWRYIFDNQFGLINQLFGVEIMWLTDATLMKIAIVIKNTWGAIGKSMILGLAAMLAIDGSYYEAAVIDGASELKKFFSITLPLITPTLFYLLITGVIANLQMYMDALIFAKGNTGAQTVVYFIWEIGIKQSNYGIAAAASTLLTITIMIITIIQFRFSAKWVFEG